jgi:MinD superfamily P-loop ATPase
VIEAVKGSDVSLLVTEPTPFGLNDLRLAVETLRKLALPFGVVINRSDIGDNQVQDYCRKENIPVLMTIPMDRSIAVAYSQGFSIVETQPEYKKKFLKLYKKVSNLVK